MTATVEISMLTVVMVIWFWQYQMTRCKILLVCRGRDARSDNTAENLPHRTDGMLIDMASRFDELM